MSHGQLFIELVCEELPVSMVGPALEGLEKGVKGLLAGVPCGAVRTWATPRRLAVAVDEVQLQKPVIEKVVTGPAASAAFKDGELTAVGLGFAKGKGVDPSALTVIEGPKGPVVAAKITEGGQATAEAVAAGLDAVVRGIPFAKSMTWGNGGVRWGRPLHRVNALLAGKVVPATVAGLTTGNESVGHRLAGAPFTFDSAETWASGLRVRSVEPDQAARKAKIRELLVEAQRRLGSDPIVDDALLDEVNLLVEWPVLVLSQFDEGLIVLPPRLLVESMKVNQRYFPVYKNGALTRHFVVISNNPWGDHDTVAEGNAKVLRPRFYDARFFYAADRKLVDERGAAWNLPLIAELAKMQWVRGLGTTADRQARVTALAVRLAPIVGADAAKVQRAGERLKVDLRTRMVGEFPELQGHVGMLLSKVAGEDDEVAKAVEEHYLPRFADDATATTPTGTALALADRLDALVGLFGIDQEPKGNDPQGLRRSALGVVRTIVAAGLRVDTTSLVALAVQNWREFIAEAPATEERDGKAAPTFAEWRKRWDKADVAAVDGLISRVDAFILARYAAWETGEGTSQDVVDAVLAVSAADPVLLRRKVAALRAVAQGPDFVAILQTFKRVLNITKGVTASLPPNPTFSHPAEGVLAEAVGVAKVRSAEAMGRLNIEGALAHVLALREPVAAFFEAVMVDDPDPAVKALRMGLLLQVADLFKQIADFSRISSR